MGRHCTAIETPKHVPATVVTSGEDLPIVHLTVLSLWPLDLFFSVRTRVASGEREPCRRLTLNGRMIAQYSRQSERRKFTKFCRSAAVRLFTGFRVLLPLKF